MNNIVNKDCLVAMQELSDNSIDCIVTSPPYNKKGLLGKVSIKKDRTIKKMTGIGIMKKVITFGINLKLIMCLIMMICLNQIIING